MVVGASPVSTATCSRYWKSHKAALPPTGAGLNSLCDFRRGHYGCEERDRSYDPIFIRADAAKAAWFQEGIEHFRGFRGSPLEENQKLRSRQPGQECSERLGDD